MNRPHVKSHKLTYMAVQRPRPCWTRLGWPSGINTLWITQLLNGTQYLPMFLTCSDKLCVSLGFAFRQYNRTTLQE